MAINWKIRKAKDTVDNTRNLRGDERLSVITDPVLQPVEQDLKLVNQVGDVKLDYARTSGSISVGPGSVIIVQRNINRIFCAIVNDSINTVYLTFGPVATANAGIRLNANGGSIVLGLSTDMPYTGIISAIAVGASNLSVTEV